jgi:hypothetical protein
MSTTKISTELIKYKPIPAGIVERALNDKLNDYISVKDFGAKGDGVTDDTAAVQAALDSLPATLIFNPGCTFKVGVLNIKGNCDIRGEGASLLGRDSGIFNVLVPLDMLWIHGFHNIQWVSNPTLTGRQFFWNGDNLAGSTAYGALNAYPISDLRIFDNVLGASKIECYGLTTLARVYRNNWQHDSSISIAPAYLYAERGTTDDNAGPVYLEDNYFDVYAPDGLGKAIIKITGGISDAHISNNYIRNNNTNSLAHVDVFTGANKMRFIGNTLIDTQLHRKQIKGSLPVAPALYQYDYISGNTFEIRLGSLNNTLIYFIGALGTITGNQFKTRNNATLGYCIQLDPSDVDIGFDTNGPVANIINANVFDMRSSYTGNAAIKVGAGTIGSSGPRYLTINGNILLGGSYFLQGGYQTYSTMVGNVWGSSSGATGVSINGSSSNNMMSANVADSQSPSIAGNTSGNLASISIPVLGNSATPDVSSADMFFVSSSTPITGFTGGYIGKRITLFTGSGGSVSPGTIQLNGSVTFTFDTYGDSLTLVQTTATRWVEVGRSVN